jgi:hypothetical protein
MMNWQTGYRYTEFAIQRPDLSWTRWYFTPIELLPAIKTRCYLAGAGLGVGIWRYYHRTNPKTEKTPVKIGDIFFDFDSEDNVAIAINEAYDCLSGFCDEYNISPASIEIYYSGNKGIGARIPCELFLKLPIYNPHEVYAELVGRYLQKYPTLDPAMYQNHRICRASNFRHAKTGRYRINLLLSELPYLSEPELIEFSKEQRVILPQRGKFSSSLWGDLRAISKARGTSAPRPEIPKFQAAGTAKVILGSEDPFDLPPRLAHLTNGEMKGSRNAALCSLVGHWQHRGFSRAAVQDAALEFNRRCPSPKPESVIKSQLKFLLK